MITFLISLLIVVLIVCIIAAICAWAISLIPGVPAFARAFVWLIAALIILLYVIQHLGVLGVRF